MALIGSVLNDCEDKIFPLKLEIYITGNSVGLGLVDLNKAKERNFFNNVNDKDFYIFKWSDDNTYCGNHIARGNFKI